MIFSLADTGTYMSVSRIIPVETGAYQLVNSIILMLSTRSPKKLFSKEFAVNWGDYPADWENILI